MHGCVRKGVCVYASTYVCVHVVWAYVHVCIHVRVHVGVPRYGVLCVLLGPLYLSWVWFRPTTTTTTSPCLAAAMAAANPVLPVQATSQPWAQTTDTPKVVRP